MDGAKGLTRGGVVELPAVVLFVVAMLYLFREEGKEGGFVGKRVALKPDGGTCQFNGDWTMNGRESGDLGRIGLYT